MTHFSESIPIIEWCLTSSIIYDIYTMNNIPPMKVWTDFYTLTMNRLTRLNK